MHSLFLFTQENNFGLKVLTWLETENDVLLNSPFIVTEESQNTNSEQTNKKQISSP